MGKVAANYGTQHIDRCFYRLYGAILGAECVATGKHIRLDACIVAVCLFVWGLFCFVKEGRDKLRHAGFMQMYHRTMGQCLSCYVLC